MVDGPDCPGSRAQAAGVAQGADKVRLPFELDVLRVPCGLRPRQGGQGLLRRDRDRSRHPVRERFRIRSPPRRERRQHLLVRLVRVDDQSRGSGRRSRLRRGHRRDGNGGGPRRARCRRQVDHGPQGKSILTTANAGVNTFLPLVLKTAGLSPPDVKIINVRRAPWSPASSRGREAPSGSSADWTTSPRRSRRRAALRPRSPTPISASIRSATASSRRARPSMAPDLVSASCRRRSSPTRRRRPSGGCRGGDGRHRRRHDERAGRQGPGPFQSSG